MIATWRQFLLEHEAEWRLPRSRDWSCVVHNNYHLHHSNINLLWFSDGEPFPRVVTKVYQRIDTPTREFANLQRAYAASSSGSVPQPFDLASRDGFWLLWMAGVPGSRPRVVDDATLSGAMSMIGELHGALRHAPAIDQKNRHAQFVQRPLEAISAFGEASSVTDGCARLATEASPAWIALLPVIPQHGDLYIDNLLSDGGRWYLTDWEIFGEIDLPAYDAFTFLYSALRRVSSAPGTWNTSVANRLPSLLNEYARQVDLSAESLRLLLPLTLVNWFHVQWADGRRQFATSMYDAVRHYFENRAHWERVFLGRSDTA